MIEKSILTAMRCLGVFVIANHPFSIKFTSFPGAIKGACRLTYLKANSKCHKGNAHTAFNHFFPAHQECSMLKNYVMNFIIALAQWVILALLSFLIITQLISASSQFSTWAFFFQTHQHLFLIGHGLVYLTLYRAWPNAIGLYVKRKHLTIGKKQWQQALFARNYVVGLFIILECLFQVRPS